MANLLILVDGKKGPGDTLVLLDCDNEPLNFSELFTILQHYKESEDSYYPRAKGLLGSKMLLKAIIEIFEGKEVEVVCRKYKLEYKVNLVDERKKPVELFVPEKKPIKMLADLL